MSTILEYYNNSQDDPKTELIAKSFINFYLYFKKVNEKKIIPQDTINYLDLSLDFSTPIEETKKETYLTNKEYQIEQFLIGLKLLNNKILKRIKKTFNIPNNYREEDVCNLIKQSYLAYATVRYKQNLIDTKAFQKDNNIYDLPKDIPNSNANIKEFEEIYIGIKRIANDGKSYEWFHVFKPQLIIRIIVDKVDGQIATLFINGAEYREVPSSFIKKLKQKIKKM